MQEICTNTDKNEIIQKSLFRRQIQLQFLFNLSNIIYFLRTFLFCFIPKWYIIVAIGTIWSNIPLKTGNAIFYTKNNILSIFRLFWSILDFLYTCLEHEFWLACEIGRNKTAKVLHLLYSLFQFCCQVFEDVAPIENPMDRLIL